MTRTEQVLKLAKEKGILRPRDLETHGIPRVYLHTLYEQGKLERSGRGLYSLPDREITERHSFVEASIRVPQGVLCLLSALRFHDLTTQNPFEVWMALAPKARVPRMDSPALRISYFSGRALTEGVETHTAEGTSLRVYSLPKTIADCFKFRNKIGLDVGLEALKECVRERRSTVSELLYFAEVCRVSTLMRTSLEAMLA